MKLNNLIRNIEILFHNSLKWNLQSLFKTVKIMMFLKLKIMTLWMKISVNLIDCLMNREKLIDILRRKQLKRMKRIDIHNWTANSISWVILRIFNSAKFSNKWRSLKNLINIFQDQSLLTALILFTCSFSNKVEISFPFVIVKMLFNYVSELIRRDLLLY